MILAGMHEVDHIWPYIADGMKKACEYSGGDTTPYWLFEICRKGEGLLFYIVKDGVVVAGLVCRVENWSGKRVLRILAACGRGMKDWIDSVLDYREWLDRWGIESVIFEGRKGWERMVPKAKVLRQVYEVDHVRNGR